MIYTKKDFERVFNKLERLFLILLIFLVSFQNLIGKDVNSTKKNCFSDIRNLYSKGCYCQIEYCRKEAYRVTELRPYCSNRKLQYYIYSNLNYVVEQKQLQFKPDSNISKLYAAQAVHVVGSNSTHNQLPALVVYSIDGYNNSTIIPLAKFSQVGSIWGVCYSHTQNKIFMSAFAKRHSAFGILGSGGIYIINNVLDKIKNRIICTNSLLSLDSLGYSTGGRELSNKRDFNSTNISHDSLMFNFVGKIGLGGIDVSEDGEHLYTLNLYDRKVYKIKLSFDSSNTKRQDISMYSFPTLSSEVGELRPFAVKFYKGKLYMGAVWDASKSQKGEDLKASVYVLSNEKINEIFTISLTYKSGLLGNGVSGWRPWIDDYNKAVVPNSGNWMIYPQPILADIEFDSDGSIVLGLMDRLGHQTGDGQLFRPTGSKTLETYRGLSGGDVLRVAYRNGHYELERNAKAGSVRTAGRDNGQGPAGGEFYNDDQFTADGITWHQETATGGLALMPETDEVLISAREPVPGQYLTGGVKWLSNKTGKATRGLSVFPADARAGYFWKTNNVGDIELITEPAPIEIGDRVWHDQNGNGLQDADEPGLADIEVQLYQQNKLLATVKTNSDGYYHFKDGDVIDGIKPQKSYAIRIPLQQTGYAKLRVPILRNAVTQQPGALPTDIDNDARAIGDTAVITLITGYAGQSIHNLDAGLQLVTAIETQAARLQISPNPATTQTELTYRGYQTNGSVTLQVRDAAGRLLQTQTGELKEGYFHQTIAVNQLIGGTYFISVTEDSHNTSAPFVKP